MNYYVDAIRNYANFSGKLSLRGYWMFVLINIVLALIVAFIPFINFTYGLFILIPSLAATVRRLRDSGKDPIWILIGFVPLIGTIWLIILLAQPSK